ncbi:AEC family transporter, partial [Clostridia bacterium OttesenSCG-928-F22]|nr:AEC family transporter [Clostridia bacterium OttesenSCG-928-F22]
MENLVLSLNAVLPLFLMMALGYVLKLLKVFDFPALKKMNGFVFKALLPISLFNNTYRSNFAESFDIAFLGYGVLSVLLIFALCMVIVPRIVKDNPSRGTIVQSLFRSNIIIFTLPVITQLFGAENTGPADILVAIIIPVYNVLAVFTLEFFRGGKLSAKKVLLGIVKNPLIIGCVLGIVAQLAQLKLPYFLDKTV